MNSRGKRLAMREDKNCSFCPLFTIAARNKHRERCKCYDMVRWIVFRLQMQKFLFPLRLFFAFLLAKPNWKSKLGAWFWSSFEKYLYKWEFWETYSFDPIIQCMRHVQTKPDRKTYLLFSSLLVLTVNLTYGVNRLLLMYICWTIRYLYNKDP